MSEAMTEFKATANQHLNRDLTAHGKWVCECESCRAIRSLTGMEKVLAVRPLVRELHRLTERLAELPDGEEKQKLLASYLNLHDALATEMAR